MEESMLYFELKLLCPELNDRYFINYQHTLLWIKTQWINFSFE
jgi:hypothetical protein